MSQKYLPGGFSLKGFRMPPKFPSNLMQSKVSSTLPSIPDQMPLFFLGPTLMLGKIKGKRKRGRQRMRWFDSITDLMDMNLSKLKEAVKDRGAWCAAVHGSWSWAWLSDWTTTQGVPPHGQGRTLEPVQTSCQTFLWRDPLSVELISCNEFSYAGVCLFLTTEHQQSL